MGALKHDDFTGKKPQQSQPGRLARQYLSKFADFRDASLEDVRDILKELEEYRCGHVCAVVVVHVLVRRWCCLRCFNGDLSNRNRCALL